MVVLSQGLQDLDGLVLVDVGCLLGGWAVIQLKCCLYAILETGLKPEDQVRTGTRNLGIHADYYKHNIYYSLVFFVQAQDETILHYLFAELGHHYHFKLAQLFHVLVMLPKVRNIFFCFIVSRVVVVTVEYYF